MKLSKNFSLAEMTKSQTATRMGMDNNPSEDEVENLRFSVSSSLGLLSNPIRVAVCDLVSSAKLKFLDNFIK